MLNNKQHFIICGCKQMQLFIKSDLSIVPCPFCGREYEVVNDRKVRLKGEKGNEEKNHNDSRRNQKNSD